MSYLALLKQIEAAEISTHTPETVLTKPTQPGFVSCVSSIQGNIEKINAANDGLESNPETTSPATLPVSPPEPANYINPLTIQDSDNRRTCSQCRNLQGRVCSVASPGGIVSANRGSRPDPERLRRCEGYLPNTADNDQRPGSERWPGLMQKGKNNEND